jgi:hypothetical protein
MQLCYQFITCAWRSVSECSSLSMEVCPFLRRLNQSQTCAQLMASSWKAVLFILYFWFPFSWILHRSLHAGIVLCSWAWQIQHVTQTLLFTCNDCITMKGCSEVLLIEDMRERIQTHPVTTWCKVLQQWTQSRYILITPHIYSEEIKSVMRYTASIHASLTVWPALLIL